MTSQCCLADDTRTCSAMDRPRPCPCPQVMQLNDADAPLKPVQWCQIHQAQMIMQLSTGLKPNRSYFMPADVMAYAQQVCVPSELVLLLLGRQRLSMQPLGHACMSSQSSTLSASDLYMHADHEAGAISSVMCTDVAGGCSSHHNIELAGGGICCTIRHGHWTYVRGPHPRWAVLH